MTTSTEFLFIDANVVDKQTLIDSAAKNVKVFELSDKTDALIQIATALKGVKNLDAIHIISHGSEGELQFANGSLNSANLSTYKSQLQKIGASLSKDGDILLYGCDVAKGDDGSAFINSLSKLTKADVAASDDLTGAANLSGNWILENHTGVIEAKTLQVTDWKNDLGIPTIVSMNPADNSTSVEAGSNLIITFSEAVHFIMGSISLYKADGTLIEVFDEFMNPNNTGWLGGGSVLGGIVTFSGNTLTINPGQNLTVGESYYITSTGIIGAGIISTSTLESVAPFTSSTYNFTVSSPIDLVAASDSGSSSTDNITNDNTPTIRVPLTSSLAVSGDTIELKLAGAVLGTPKTKVLDSTDVTTNGYVDFTVASGDLGLDGDKVFTAALTDQQSTPVTTTLPGDLTITLDTTKPIAALTTATLAPASNAVVQSTEIGTAYLVKDTVTVPNLASITGAADNNFNSVAINSANTNTNLEATGLLDGTYKLYTVDVAGNLSDPSSDTVTIATPPPVVQFGSIRDFVSVSGGSYVESSIAGAISGKTAFTLSYWINPTTLDANQALFGQNDQLEVIINGSGNLEAWLPNSGVSIPNAGGMIANQWNNIVITGDSNANALNVYVNGVLDVNGSSGVSGTFNYQAVTGIHDKFRGGNHISNPTANQPLAGSLDDVAFWDTALTQADVTRLYTATSPAKVSYANLQYLWDFNESSGTSTANKVLNGTAATLDFVNNGSTVTRGSTTTLDATTTVTFAENTVNAAVQPLNFQTIITDADSANFNGGNLTVSFTSGSTQDQLSIANQGTGTSLISVSGSTVKYQDVTIGSIDSTHNGVNGANLVVNFSATAATPAAVQALVEALTYQNTSNSPTISRDISIVLTDNTATASAPITKTIIVTAENDTPTITSLDSGYNFVGNTSTEPNVGDYVDLPDVESSVFNGSFTLEAWINESSYGYWTRILDFGNGASDDNILWASSNETSGRMAFQIYNGSTGGTIVTANQNIPLNQWVHVAITYDGTTATLYQDGVAVGSTPISAPDNVTRVNNYIGKSNWGVDDFLNARLKDVRVWTEARSAEQIQANMNAVSPVDEDHKLYARYLLDNNANDSATTPHNGTLHQTDEGGSFLAGNTNLLDISGTQYNPITVKNFVVSDADENGDTTVVFNVTNDNGDFTGKLTLATNIQDGITEDQIQFNGTASVTITAPLSVINTTIAAGGFSYFAVNNNPETEMAAHFNTAIQNAFGLSDVGWRAKPTFVDINGDGDLDAFVGGSNGTILYYENTGDADNPTFEIPNVTPEGLTTLLANTGNTNASPTFADIDNDGDLDAFIGESDGSIAFYENTGDAEAPTFTVPEIPTGLTALLANLQSDGTTPNEIANPTFADIDDDGDLDAFVGESDGTIAFYENTPDVEGNATFAVPVETPDGLANLLVDFGSRAKPTFADIDDDGDLDAFIGNVSGNTQFFENISTYNDETETYTIQFAGSQTNPFGLTSAGWWSAPTFADINNDGTLDAFIGSGSGNVLFFENTPAAAAPVDYGQNVTISISATDNNGAIGDNHVNIVLSTAALIVTTNSDSDDDATFGANLADDIADGTGDGGLSLREALHWVPENGIVRFDKTTWGDVSTITLSDSVDVKAGVTFDTDTANILTISGSALNLLGTMNVNNGSEDSFIINSVLAGSSRDLAKFGEGTLTLTATNNDEGGYTGNTLIYQGIVSVISHNNIGTGYVQIGGKGQGVLEITESDDDFANVLMVAAPNGEVKVSDGQTVKLTGKLDEDPNGSFNDLFKTGGGTLILASEENEAGLSGDIYVIDGEVQVESDDAMPAGEIYLADGKELQFDGDADTTINSTMNLNGDANVNVNNASKIVTISGEIKGGVGKDFTKQGAGTLNLTGTNSYAGATTVTSGEIKVNGSLPNTASVSVGNGATLGGSGTIGTFGSAGTKGQVTIGEGGSLAPGNSPGTITLNKGLTLSNGAKLKIQLGDAGSTTAFDKVVVKGAVNITGSTLELTATNNFSGSSFTIIDNDGSDAIIGTFAGIANNSVVTANGKQFTISYTGGTGNDVTLTSYTPPSGDDTPPPIPPKVEPKPEPKPELVIQKPVSKEVESQVPSASGVKGDGNGDGIPDVDQKNVISLPTQKDLVDTKDAPKVFLSIELPTGQTLTKAEIKSVPVTENEKITFKTETVDKKGNTVVTDTPITQETAPFGLFEFNFAGVPTIKDATTGAVKGGTTDVKLYLDDKQTVEKYLKQTVSGTWEAIPFTYVYDEKLGKTVVAFSLTDGDKFDLDGKIDGGISDPGTPIITPKLTVAPVPAPVVELSAPTEKVFVGYGSEFELASGAAQVFGSSLREILTLKAGASNVIVDQNVEQVNLAGKFADFTFEQQGNSLKVINNSITVAKITVQDDSNGTLLGFTDGLRSASFTNAKISVADKIVAADDIPLAILQKAGVYLAGVSANPITVGGNSVSVYGSQASDKVGLSAFATNAIIDANVEQVNFAGKFADYSFIPVGNSLNVLLGTTQIANIVIQDDSNGTTLSFAEQSYSAHFVTSATALQIEITGISAIV